MDKISQIVSPSARGSTADTRNAPAVRPGTPSFGRPVGESPRGEKDDLSTAQRVGIIHDDLVEQKRARNEAKVANDVSNRFFASQAAPTPASAHAASGISAAHGSPSIRGQMVADAVAESREPLEVGNSARIDSLAEDDTPIATPSRFTPRGSLVDVRA